ncbi:MAG: helix-hairpin-helix domain-containing protein [Gammaproteobacteria bacterium]|nr:helix-hairpin-helix domain-containing protein [Gammaproteobacteria bacterium]
MIVGVSLAQAGPVNINTADAKTIAKELDNVGIKKAEAIVAYRDEHGRFKNAVELTNVSGIGRRTFEANLDNIKVRDRNDEE